jgi:2-dehydro-3-deoxygalactonokinase
VLCGAVGGRGGWREAPYVECPATSDALAATLLRIEPEPPPFQGRTLRIVPGVLDRASSPVADTMRGEESQVVGLLHSGRFDGGVVCLPGTHSKWVRVRDGAIAAIHTAMTGEVYALLRRHSVLARLMERDETAVLDSGSFDAGLRRSRDPGGLLHHLFGVRVEGLFGRLGPAQAPSYLSGLLIGHEVRAQTTGTRKVHLVASERLGAAYKIALAAFGIDSELHSEELAATGMHVLARSP